MYQIVEDKKVITVNDWLRAGLTRHQFEHDSKSGRLTIYRRGIHGNTLIEVDSIRRPDRRHAIEAAFGSEGSVLKTIEMDQAALAFYRGEGLPEMLLEKYTNEASLLNACAEHYMQHVSIRTERGKKPLVVQFYRYCVSFCKEYKEAYPHGLPGNLRAFERKYKEYLKGGYASLIHQGLGNTNHEKLNESAKEWLIARYASNINRCTVMQLYIEYNERAKKEGWSELSSEKTIHRYLHLPEVQPLWCGSRYGELYAKEKYIRHQKTLLPQVRDALWYGDGTKMNLYFLNENGKASTVNVYEVMDVYSECFLGYHISETEDFETQYKAYKMAMYFSGHKPYEIRFDNQGGHKKLKSGQFFKSLSKLAINTQPYNGKSKTIESAFGRFQSQFLHRLWYFTGQNVTAKKQESKANVEYILANRQNLPTLSEAKRAYEQCRMDWNNAPHPATGISRLAMYESSTNPQTQKIEQIDMISLFGVINKKAITYRSNGIVMQFQNQKYQYEVLTIEEKPDYDFIRNNTGRKFYVGYDPEDMLTVCLFTKKQGGGLKFETVAQKYIEIHRDIQSQSSFDKEWIRYTNDQNKAMRASMQEDTESLLERHQLHPAQHGHTMPQPKGMGKVKKVVKKETVGTVQKKESELVPTLEGDAGFSIDWEKIY
jgi:hypothetical protein